MDRERAAELLELRRPHLLLYIRAILGARQACEDVLQEAAMICLRKHDDIPDAAAFEGWIRRVCRFEALKQRERQARERPAAAERLALLCESELVQAAETMAEGRLAALRACLGRLPAASRELIRLRYAEACPGEEIARRLGRPLNTIYVTLCRLHKALAECVRGHLAREDAHGP
jgi:RNA polymerase sigma-70 factor (ECF subfamily)